MQPWHEREAEMELVIGFILGIGFLAVVQHLTWDYSSLHAKSRRADAELGDMLSDADIDAILFQDEPR